MAIDREIIQKYFDFFQEEEGKTVTHLTWSRFQLDLKTEMFGGREELRPVVNNFGFIASDIWNLKICAFKLDFLNNLRNAKKIDDILWFQMGTTDVEFFFTELRSVFDYLSIIIAHLSPRDIRQIKGNGKSFRQLYQWLEGKPELHNDFDECLTDLVLGCDWFFDIRRIRDAIRHKGAGAAVVAFNDKIQFHVLYPNYNNGINIPEIMPNGNLVNFEFCSIYYLAYLNNFMETLSEIMYEKELVQKRIGRITEHHTSNVLLMSWTDQFLKHLDSL